MSTNLFSYCCGGWKSEISFRGLTLRNYQGTFILEVREETLFSCLFQLPMAHFYFLTCDCPLPTPIFKAHHGNLCFHHHIISSAVKLPSASFFFFNMYLFASSLSCNMQASLSGGMGAPESVASAVEVCGLRCPVACGWDLSSPTRDRAPSPVFKGRFLATGPPGKSLRLPLVRTLVIIWKAPYPDNPG